MQLSGSEYSSQDHKKNLEKLKETLQFATWVREDYRESELRYERFLMLQQLCKRMKKFYASELAKTEAENRNRFRKASQFIRKLVDLDEYTDSDLTAEQCIDDSSRNNTGLDMSISMQPLLDSQ